MRAAAPLALVLLAACATSVNTQHVRFRGLLELTARDVMRGYAEGRVPKDRALMILTVANAANAALIDDAIAAATGASRDDTWPRVELAREKLLLLIDEHLKEANR
jgi:hypothetical protein